MRSRLQFYNGLFLTLLGGVATAHSVAAENENMILAAASTLGVGVIMVANGFHADAWKNSLSTLGFSLVLSAIVAVTAPSKMLAAHAGMIIITFAIIHRNAVELVEKTLTRNAVIARALEAIVISITGSAAIDAIAVSPLSLADLLKIAATFLLIHLWVVTFRH